MDEEGALRGGRGGGVDVEGGGEGAERGAQLVVGGVCICEGFGGCGRGKGRFVAAAVAVAVRGAGEGEGSPGAALHACWVGGRVLQAWRGLEDAREADSRFL